MLNENGRFNNLPGATFNAPDKGELTRGTGAPRFVNAGTFNKASGTSELWIKYLPFDNSGTVNFPGGTLRIGEGNSSGTFVGGANTTLHFDNGPATHNLLAGSNVEAPSLLISSGFVNLEGAVRVGTATNISGQANPTFTLKTGATVHSLGSTLTIDGGIFDMGSGTAFTIPTFTFNRGTLTGARDLAVSGQFTWTGGKLHGTGRTIANGTLLMPTSTSGRRDLDGRRLENNGTATWSGRVIYAYHGGVIQNNASGTLELTADDRFMMWCNYTVTQTNLQKCFRDGLQPQFINAGTVRKTTGTGILRLWYQPWNSDDGLCVGTLEHDHKDKECPVLFTNSGTVEARSGTLSFGGYTQTGGVLSLAGGNVGAMSGTTITLDGGRLAGTGSVEGALRNNARVDVGGTPGTLTVKGAYTQTSAGTLNIELGGSIAGTGFDQLVVDGAATLAGTLNITPINGYTPAAKQTFALLTYTSRSGSFSTSSNGYTLTYGTSGVTATKQ
jgi:hypothetical protein